MFGLEFSKWIDLVEVVALVGGGFWALYLYTTSRRGEVKVAIRCEPRLIRDFDERHALLVVKIVLSNPSTVLWRWQESLVTLFDARRLTDGGGVRLVPFKQADPFLPIYGTISEDAEAVARGDVFSYFPGQDISLEPGEQVESELVFPVDKEKLGLMAMRVWFSGFQRRFSRQPYEWATFLYIDPATLEPVPAGTGSKMEPS